LRRSTRIGIWVIALVIVGLAVTVYLGSAERRARFWAWRGAGREAAMEKKRFIARFDSLCDARLYPVVWKVGVFTRSRFEGDRERWILTVSSGEWQRRDEASRKDLVATVWTAFCGTREQAGGKAEDASLVIQDGQGETLARCSPADGLKLLE
jgi:hypothetical protein